MADQAEPPALATFEGHIGAEAQERLRGYAAVVQCVAFGDAGTVVSGGSDKKARVWDARTGVERPFSRQDRKGGYTFSEVSGVAVARKRGLVAYTSEDGCLRLMNFATGDFAGCHDPAGATSNVVWSPDERLIACGLCGNDDGEITVLKPPNFTMFFPEYYLDGERPDELDDDDDGEWRDPAVLCRLDHGPEQHGGSAGDFCDYFAWVDSTTLVSAHRGRNVIWDVVSGTEMYRFDEPATQVATSPVEPLIALSFDGYSTRRIATRLARFTRDGDQFHVTRTETIQGSKWGCMPSFTPDGLQLAIVEEPPHRPASPQLILYNVRSGLAERRIQMGRLGRIWDISPDGRRLAIVGPTRQGETVVVCALETPRTAFYKLLLLRAAPKGTKLRVTTTDAASTGHLVLFRLVDKGNADVAAYALKFIL